MNADEQAIRDLIAQWHSATGAGNVEAVLCLMSEDAVFLVAGHPPMKGRSNFEKQLRDVLATHRIESSGEIQEIEVSGDLAFCWTMLDVRITTKTDGKSLARSGSSLSILRKQADGSWLLVRDANLLPPAQ